jgi:predicted DNA-binding transcriptional regulator AlpA
MLKSEIDKIINQIIERIISGVVDQIPKEPAPSDSEKQNETHLLSVTDFSRRYSISRPVVYGLINNGKLPCYQISGSSKKYLKPEDVERVLERIPILPIEESYPEFETRIRKGKKFGDKLWKQFTATNNKKTLSQFSLWLFENNLTKSVNNFLIINLKHNKHEE